MCPIKRSANWGGFTKSVKLISEEIPAGTRKYAKEAQRYSAPPIRLSAVFILFLSYAFLFGTVRVTGQRPFQLPRCLLWYSLCAFLLCFSIGTHWFMVSSPFLSYLLKAFVGLRLYVLTEFQIISMTADEHLIRQFL